MNKNIGAGHSEIIQEKVDMGLPKSKLETPEYSDYTIYIGRMHVQDHESGTISRGPCKIGRARYVNTVQRARNQGGGDFRIYKRINVYNNDHTKTIENFVKVKYGHKKIKGPQNQTELYDFNDHELQSIVNDIEQNFKEIIKDIKDYM